MFLTSILIAIKYLDDIYYKNEYYAKVGGVSKDELNLLEIVFLDMIEFELYVPSSVY